MLKKIISNIVVYKPKITKHKESVHQNVEPMHFQALLNAVINSFGGIYWWKDIHGIYRGCNKNAIELLGLDSEIDILGKTDYELPWKQHADQLVINDNLVIAKKEALTYEERAIDAKGKEHIFQVTKTPLLDENNKVIGTIGTSIDITTKKEIDQLKLENEHQQIAIQEKFTTLAHKIAHDINSPLSALKMISMKCDELPENKRLALRNIADSILDISNNLIRNYQKKDNFNTLEVESRQPLLAYDLLIKILNERKAQYQYRAIKFETEFSNEAHFAFIHMQKTAFQRMMSNLINNAVDALENRSNGTILIRLSAHVDSLIIQVRDNGKGMSAEMIEKMRKRQEFTAGKAHGHGLGLQQVWDTLEYNQGVVNIQSNLNQGTCIQLTFPRVAPSRWIAQEIRLVPSNIIVILDDDESIHTAWNLRFASFFKSYPNLRMHHFIQGQDVLDFIAALNQKERNLVYFFSDYELLNQNKNGLQIIKTSGVKQSLLVTSYYLNPQIIEEIDQIGIKVLPKQMAPVIPIYVT